MDIMSEDFMSCI